MLVIQGITILPFFTFPIPKPQRF